MNDTLAGPRSVAALNRSPDAALTIGAVKSLSVITAREIEKSAAGSPGHACALNEQATITFRPAMSKPPSVTVCDKNVPWLRSTYSGSSSSDRESVDSPPLVTVPDHVRRSPRGSSQAGGVNVHVPPVAYGAPPASRAKIPPPPAQRSSSAMPNWPGRRDEIQPEEASRIGAALPSGVWHVQTRYVPRLRRRGEPENCDDDPQHQRASLLHRARS